MSAKKITDDEFIRLWGVTTSVTAIAKIAGLSVRQANRRRRSIEAAQGIEFSKKPISKQARFIIEPRDGVELIFSDAHYWPGILTTAQRALLRFVEELQPIRIHANGDLFDGAGISRHPPIGWEGQPSVQEQLDVTKERLDAIEAVAPESCELFWELGNHDARYETYLASKVPEYRNVEGFHLQDKFPNWVPAWSVHVGDQLVVKHRFKGGLNSALSNSLWSGRSIATGHDHMLGVRMLTDYNGIRFGINTGTLAEPDSEPFVDYTEDNPKNWQSGFIVNTYRDGKLLLPEPVLVIRPGVVWWRGAEMRV